jgi:hypothetical protein
MLGQPALAISRSGERFSGTPASFRQGTLGSYLAFAGAYASRHGFIDEDTVVQINSTGPWGLTYVNPKDDPRQKTQ